MSAPSGFERLPEELRQWLFSYCESSTILHLCLTSKAVYDACIYSLLYRIDLSTHNSTDFRRHQYYSNINVPVNYARIQHTTAEQQLMLRQNKLLRLLVQKPHLAAKTQSLEWTLLDPEQWNFLAPTNRIEYESRTYIELLWKVLPCFTNITNIDLAFMTGFLLYTIPPPSLFQTATSISLSGIASFDLLSSIFTSINPSALKHLRLNNLQTFADFENILDTLSPDDIASHRRNRHGVAQGYLAPLTGHCTSLRSFHYHSTAEYFDGARQRPQAEVADWIQHMSDETQRYAEIAAFIASVQPTLRELLFEHGPDIDYFGPAFGQRHHTAFRDLQIHTDSLPMDHLFETHLLPVLVAGPWPRLRKMTVMGIGHWKPIDAWSESATPAEIAYLHSKTLDFRDKVLQLWDAVPDGCEVLVRDEASRPFHNLRDDMSHDW